MSTVSCSKLCVHSFVFVSITLRPSFEKTSLPCRRSADSYILSYALRGGFFMTFIILRSASCAERRGKRESFSENIGVSYAAARCFYTAKKPCFHFMTICPPFATTTITHRSMAHGSGSLGSPLAGLSQLATSASGRRRGSERGPLLP